ncbi:TonB-dependent receptor [Marinicauda algicola]|uniref:TonB-dependent receptor n=1 Tax=Marinicauda algicola TaxID=2029849 RepID=A0A4S2H3I7_9PROT|nr:TonB-dependent receptor [Marinicauda algicola]TGY90134.1 TonB-dependent receptor [Marinicauda algicola]
MTYRDLLLGTAGMLSIIAAGPALAQEPTQDQEIGGDDLVEAGEAPAAADTIVVLGQRIQFRNRSDETEPVLEYDSEYFQRFEPLTAGDALRRVPSVTFLSDVIESDGPRFRGLAPAYTQILIDGERVPGGEADRSFFMDRIPAELIERVEIVRSSSARRTGDAVAGALNIVLRDGYDLDGGYVRAGALRFDDGEIKPSFGAVYGGELGQGRILLGANVQGRYNPKEKFSLRYGDSPENDPAFATNEFDNREDQTDTRDGTDYSFNGRYTVDMADGSEFEIGGYLTFTDRTENERSFEYDDPTAVTGPVPGGNLLTDNQQRQEIEQINWTIDTEYERPAFGGEMEARLGYSIFDGENNNNEDEIDFEDGEIGLERELESIEDQELTFELSQVWEMRSGVAFEIGLFAQDKQRDTEILAGDEDQPFAQPWDQFSDQPFDLGFARPDVDTFDGSVSAIEEQRLDIYFVFNGENGPLSWEAGLRYENTYGDITDEVTPQSVENNYSFLLPSAHLRYELTPEDRVYASVARTVRRPGFDFINPALLEEEIEDDDFLGNPNLDPESAWGFDLGYERRIATNGVFGVNVFYRAVEDLIELANTGMEGSEGPGTFVYQPRNTGDGDVYGIEFDLSTPLTMFGLENTGVFANYSWLDSEVTDFLGDRRFNSQSDYVFNVGFIQSLPAWDSAFGATYREQGDAFERVIAEEVTTSYGADLEVFVERSFGESVTVRLVGQNLLNASKDEVFNKFDNLADQIARDFDEYELETEEAGPVVQLMVRAAF